MSRRFVKWFHCVRLISVGELRILWPHPHWASKPEGPDSRPKCYAENEANRIDCAFSALGDVESAFRKNYATARIVLAILKQNNDELRDGSVFHIGIVNELIKHVREEDGSLLYWQILPIIRAWSVSPHSNELDAMYQTSLANASTALTAFDSNVHKVADILAQLAANSAMEDMRPRIVEHF